MNLSLCCHYVSEPDFYLTFEWSVPCPCAGFTCEHRAVLALWMALKEAVFCNSFNPCCTTVFKTVHFNGRGTVLQLQWQLVFSAQSQFHWAEIVGPSWAVLTRRLLRRPPQLLNRWCFLLCSCWIYQYSCVQSGMRKTSVNYWSQACRYRIVLVFIYGVPKAKTLHRNCNLVK